VFSRPRRQFESHLGHSISPRQRRFCFDVCTKLAIASPDGLGRGLWPGCRGAYAGVWVAGSGTWLVGPPPAVVGLCGSSFRFCRVGRVWPTLVHGSPIRKQHDRDRTSPRRMPIGSCHGATRTFCPAKEGVDSVHTYVCFIGAVVTASRVQASHRCMGLLAPVSERNKPCGVSDIWRRSVIAMSPSRLIDCLVWLGFRDVEVSRHRIGWDKERPP
jgi:hypothetical protein